MGAALPWITAVLLAAAAYAVGGMRRRPLRGTEPPWKTVLLVADPELGGVPLQALHVATRLVGPGGVLHVLAPVRLPLAVPLEAPAGEETERAAALLDQVERVAGSSGVAVLSHLRRGRAVRSMLREAVRKVGADAVIVQCPPHQWSELAAEIAPAQAVVVPADG